MRRRLRRPRSRPDRGAPRFALRKEERAAAAML